MEVTMLGIRFMKVPPTTYVMQFKKGRVRREGSGLSFFYYAPTSSIVAVPIASVDAPFAFSEVTADFQSVTIQGQLTYRVADAKKLAALLDFSLDPAGRYVSEDPRKLTERLVQHTQFLTRAVTQRLTLGEALVGAERLSAEVLSGLEASATARGLGIEVMALSILSIKATPEMGKALEAEVREGLNRRADEAIYARRNAAVEQERRIKESELNTEIAVEEKQRQIRETQMAAEIAVEEQRSTLISHKVENDRKQADSTAYGIEATIKPLRDLDWHTLMMLSAGGGDPRTSIAMAFQEIAKNASRIGELNVTPDLLKSLLGESKR